MQKCLFFQDSLTGSLRNRLEKWAKPFLLLREPLLVLWQRASLTRRTDAQCHEETRIHVCDCGSPSCWPTIYPELTTSAQGWGTLVPAHRPTPPATRRRCHVKEPWLLFWSEGLQTENAAVGILFPQRQGCLLRSCWTTWYMRRPPTLRVPGQSLR